MGGLEREIKELEGREKEREKREEREMMGGFYFHCCGGCTFDTL